jgi:hypothetical protein
MKNHVGSPGNAAVNSVVIDFQAEIIGSPSPDDLLALNTEN